MREFSVPATFTVPEGASCADAVARNAAEAPTYPLFRKLVGENWTDVTAKEFADNVNKVAKGLVALGVNKGDRVALLSNTRYEWVVLDYAIWTAGGVTVPIYASSSPDQVKWILEDSAAVGLVVETTENASTHKAVADEAKDLKKVLVIDEGALDELVAAGADVSDEDIAARVNSVTAADPATLIYTSGTTGRPKGVQLTHFNLQAEVQSILASSLSEYLQQNAKTLLFLPLAHIFARVISIACVEVRVTVGHTSDIPNIVAHLGSFQPTVLLAVPRIFEKVYNGARLKAHAAGKGKIFDKAADTAIAWSKAQDEGGAGFGLKAKHALFSKLVYGKLLAALGGQCTAAIAGGAPLGARLGHFFRGAGLKVYEGYGLTETSAAITVNTPGHHRIGSVGRPLPGAKVRIAEDGEVLLSGPVVFDGYWQNEKATKESIVDGWFHTGDIGSLDNDGFLSITGRKKEIIVTAGGKNVSPSGLEDVLRSSAIVSQAMVVGDQKPYIAAVLTLDPEAIPGWLERNGKPADTSVGSLRNDPDLIAEIDAVVAQANQTVSNAEAIKKYKILDIDFTEATGELTPSMKLKRNVVAQKFADEIEGLYTK
ncbi:long-chain fatty acid--CoA ligase [Hoyosella rhizosphaerae]|uniref:Acyl-CoA synthetase n=1 Tax=Hoyosella rhizosphaerae TaxID=1755582 RepID=A0A916UF12_9ACTN|nr:AMP-dependent synthetase/ligase [Hoyosella rhizosphaerae]MBN4927944.1 long-chain fatty acid--CoA ligase [Hoyosella rhizosphaerae]GGC71191.1 putative long-chain-fatty-acid--CoA ligase FadD [Hoyosella rhizosphaerae]